MKYIKLFGCAMLLVIVGVVAYIVRAVPTATATSASVVSPDTKDVSVDPAHFPYALHKIQDFDLTEGKLGDQFIKFSKQTRISIGYSASDPQPHGNLVRGSYSPNEVLDILLRDTGCKRTDRETVAMIIISCI